MTPAAILAIPKDNPYLLFHVDTKKEVTQIYRKLAMEWHTDRNPANSDVMAHINVLYDAALKQLLAGTFTSPDIVYINSTVGKFKLRFLSKRSFELGMIYIAHGYVLYVVEKKHQELFNNAVKSLSSLHYADNDMRQEISKHIPVHKAYEGEEFLYLLISKKPEELLLADVQEKKPLELKHAIWVISNLHGFRCYLNWAKLVHQGFHPDNLLIDPTKHEVRVIGGWWYTKPVNSELKFLPQYAVNTASKDIIKAKKANILLDGELMKMVARILFGDPAGVRYSKDFPSALKLWSVSPSSTNPIKDFDGWYKLIENVFGARRYAILELKSSDIYEGVS